MNNVIDIKKDLDKSKIYEKIKALRHEACKIKHSALSSRGINHARIKLIKREIARALTRIRSNI